jgi:hypothetical protein
LFLLAAAHGKPRQAIDRYLLLGRLDEARAAAAMRKLRPDFTIVKARAEEYYENPTDTERELN